MADSRSLDKNTQRALIGAGLAAAAGTAAFLLTRRTGSSGAPIEEISDAPDHVWRRGNSRYDAELFGKTVTVGRPREQLFEEWRDFTRFPRFMDNVESVEKLDGKRSRWSVDRVGKRAGIRDHHPGPRRIPRCRAGTRNDGSPCDALRPAGGDRRQGLREAVPARAAHPGTPRPPALQAADGNGRGRHQRLALRAQQRIPDRAADLGEHRCAH